MFVVNYFNLVKEKMEKVYFSRFDDALTFLETRYNVIDFDDHFVKISVIKECLEE